MSNDNENIDLIDEKDEISEEIAEIMKGRDVDIEEAEAIAETMDELGVSEDDATEIVEEEGI